MPRKELPFLCMKIARYIWLSINSEFFFKFFSQPIPEDWDKLYRCFSPEYRRRDMTAPRRRNAMGSPTAMKRGTAAYRRTRKPPGWTCVPGASSRPGSIWPTTRPTGESIGEEVTSPRLDIKIMYEAVRTTPVLSPCRRLRREHAGPRAGHRAGHRESPGTWETGRNKREDARREAVRRSELRTRKQDRACGKTTIGGW